MTKVMSQAYAEVDEILKYMPNEYVEKVPMKFRKLFAEGRLDNYNPKIDPNKSIHEQNLVYETLVILTILKYNFWCKSEEEKAKLLEQMKEIDRKNAEKYDISARMNKSSIFEKSIEEKVSLDNLPVKVEEKSWFVKILEKIKSIFKR